MAMQCGRREFQQLSYCRDRPGLACHSRFLTSYVCIPGSFCLDTRNIPQHECSLTDVFMNWIPKRMSGKSPSRPCRNGHGGLLGLGGGGRGGPLGRLPPLLLRNLAPLHPQLRSRCRRGGPSPVDGRPCPLSGSLHGCCRCRRGRRGPGQGVDGLLAGVIGGVAVGGGGTLEGLSCKVSLV